MTAKYIIRCDHFQWLLCKLKTPRDAAQAVAGDNDPYAVVGHYPTMRGLLTGVREVCVRDGTKSGQGLEGVLRLLFEKLAASDALIAQHAEEAEKSIVRLRTNLPLVERARVMRKARLAKLAEAREPTLDEVDGPDAEQVTALDKLDGLEYSPSPEKRIEAATKALKD
jgi:hypothetical protein